MKLSRPSKKFLIALTVAILLSFTGVNQEQVSEAVGYVQSSQPGMYTVIHVDDGDTITINMNGQKERVRLIGVDTPELHHPQKPVQCFAEAAQQFSANLIANQPVRLQADPLDDNRDLYGRLLRYVYLKDGTVLNKELVAKGYGFAYTRFPFTIKAEIIVLEQAARQSRLGLWGNCTINVDEDTPQTNDV